MSDLLVVENPLPFMLGSRLASEILSTGNAEATTVNNLISPLELCLPGVLKTLPVVNILI